ncbi:hypothetical protein NLG97_g5265 [Lecanicillium saksenae]|uniref:Uncharacterized protein n=1 Tax=Lecanicillium saksenae TaxID=468837 RepID=A0ACC1QUT4_9HYPO|nr:hypothetical protein NLG97_g5265 [Lecanicillium saksenae]
MLVLLVVAGMLFLFALAECPDDQSGARDADSDDERNPVAPDAALAGEARRRDEIGSCHAQFDEMSWNAQMIWGQSNLPVGFTSVLVADKMVAGGCSNNVNNVEQPRRLPSNALAPEAVTVNSVTAQPHAPAEAGKRRRAQST